MNDITLTVFRTPDELQAQPDGELFSHHPDTFPLLLVRADNQNSGHMLDAFSRRVLDMVRAKLDTRECNDVRFVSLLVDQDQSQDELTWVAKQLQADGAVCVHDTSCTARGPLSACSPCAVQDVHVDVDGMIQVADGVWKAGELASDSAAIVCQAGANWFGVHDDVIDQVKDCLTRAVFGRRVDGFQGVDFCDYIRLQRGKQYIFASWDKLGTSNVVKVYYGHPDQEFKAARSLSFHEFCSFMSAKEAPRGGDMELVNVSSRDYYDGYQVLLLSVDNIRKQMWW